MFERNYIIYKVKKQANLSELTPDFVNLLTIFKQKLQKEYKTDIKLIGKDNDRVEYYISFNKSPIKLLKHYPSNLRVEIILFRNKVFIWAEDEIIYNMFEEPRN